jgi:hypothetical protein
MTQKSGSKSVKNKLCWNCEGSVAKHLENCPYCGVYLSPDESLASTQTVMKAPYNPPEKNPSEAIPEPPYAPQTQPADEAIEKAPLSAQQNQFQEVFLPVFTLSAGLVALLFALLLLLFSTHGKLVMEWDASLWGWYAAGGLLLLALGWKFLQQKSDQ